MGASCRRSTIALCELWGREASRELDLLKVAVELPRRQALAQLNLIGQIGQHDAIEFQEVHHLHALLSQRAREQTLIEAGLKLIGWLSKKHLTQAQLQVVLCQFGPTSQVLSRSDGLHVQQCQLCSLPCQKHQHLPPHERDVFQLMRVDDSGHLAKHVIATKPLVEIDRDVLRRYPQDVGYASGGGSGARINLSKVSVHAGQIVTYFVGGGGVGGQGGAVLTPPYGVYALGTGGGGGSSTNVFLDGSPLVIAGGGGGGASAMHDHRVTVVPATGEGGSACATPEGGAGANGSDGVQGGKGGASGKGGADGDRRFQFPWFTGGKDGYGGTGSGFGTSIGDGPADGGGGDGAGSGSYQSSYGTGGGGGGYGGGGGGPLDGLPIAMVGGGGAGGSLWPGMQPNSPNSPNCIPALNAGAAAASNSAPGIAGGDGSLKITWTASPVTVPTPLVLAVPGLNGLGMFLLGLGVAAGGLMRRQKRTRQRT